jgi:hypothetical protein
MNLISILLHPAWLALPSLLFLALCLPVIVANLPDTEVWELSLPELDTLYADYRSRLLIAGTIADDMDAVFRDFDRVLRRPG